MIIARIYSKLAQKGSWWSHGLQYTFTENVCIGNVWDVVHGTVVRDIPTL